ncbi:DNA adenine methylase [Bifidobacterium vansinderenii]|uniref:site-specific DNA-methyltransferase (adenine-specific) n=1 Tax=Bifidobacterium vansinderenii TaxID=1984871 RepID=A0A229VXV6_9BIFI|nr:DNA adenine methylase [Bifidobacterium vansinderenii]OXN00376.1 DNA methyltransferase [Bifidobacterium vansinderenii]
MYATPRIRSGKMLSVPLVSNHDVVSPLRYPGGKSVLSRYVASLIGMLGLRDATYVEPYAGGAGVALRLLRDGTVPKVVINDYDPNVFAFWHSAINDSTSFLEIFDKTEPTIEEWHRQKDIIRNPGNELDRGFAFFFLNRTNRSGVLNGGVIGGLKQSGAYKVGARYNKDSLRKKLEFLGSCSDSIEVLNEDGRAVVERFIGDDRAFIYADPPYVEKGRSLYMNAFDESQHENLGKTLNGHTCSRWMLTYDDTSLVRELYKDRYGGLFPLSYSASSRRSANELMIFSDTLGEAIACNAAEGE